MARSSEAVLGLVGRIYDAALDPTLWPDALISLTDAVGGSQVMMGLHDFSTRSAAIVAPRLSQEDLAAYQDHWGRDDILWRRTNRAPVGQVLEAERFVPRQEFLSTQVYNEWHRPLGIGAAGLGVNLFLRDGVPAVCGIKRPAHRDEFSRDEVKLFSDVAPHLVRAVEIHRRMEGWARAEEAVHAIADTERSCVVVVDARRRVLETDLAARRLLDGRNGLCIEDGRLTARDPTAAAKLEGLIDHCGRQERVPAGGSLVVPRGHGRAPLRLEVAPVSRRSQEARFEWLGLQSPTAIVAIRDSECAQSLSKEHLMEIFALTPAEAELAIEMAKGDGRQAAARRLGISVGTVRTHLMRVFEKTGVSRQAELVQLLLGFEGRR